MNISLQKLMQNATGKSRQILKHLQEQNSKETTVLALTKETKDVPPTKETKVFPIWFLINVFWRIYTHRKAANCKGLNIFNPKQLTYWSLRWTCSDWSLLLFMFRLYFTDQSPLLFIIQIFWFLSFNSFNISSVYKTYTWTRDFHI